MTDADAGGRVGKVRKLTTQAEDEHGASTSRAAETVRVERGTSTTLGFTVPTISELIAAGYIPDNPCMVCRLREPSDMLRQLCVCTTIRAHKACWEEWLAASGSDACHLCGRALHVYREVLYSAPAALWVWTTRHACKVQLLIMLMLAASAATEAVLLGVYLHLVLQEAPLPTPRATGWLALLCVAVLFLQAVVITRLWTRNKALFRSWYLSTVTVQLLGLPAEDRDP